MSDFKNFYEKYHASRFLPKKIIDEKNFTYKHIISVLDKFCKDRDVLDVGSGVGTIDFYLASKGKNVTGIEISEKAIDISQKSLRVFNLKGRVKFICGDFLKLKFRRTFSFVICSEVLEHLKDDNAAIKKILNLVKKDGLVMITVPSKNAPLIKFGVIKKFDERSGHLRRYYLDDLKHLIEKNRFKVIFSKKTEGILRNSLFVFKFGRLIIRVANRFGFISDIITFLDDISLNLFGESQIIIIATK